MDYWDLPARYGSLDAALARSQATFLLLSFTSDWLYPTSESVAIADALRRLGRPATHADLASSAGHDAFLVDGEAQAPLIEEFLAAL
jgi:homoserine O-acetyltransferase/O-succinyltransferase